VLCKSHHPPFALTLLHFQTENKNYSYTAWETAAVRRKDMLFAAVIAVACALLMQACATAQERQMRSMARVYDTPYDRVCSSVEELLKKDLKCLLKKNDRDGGHFETEWVHRMDTEGNKRWMVRADVRKVKNGVEVVLYKKIELQDSVSKSLDKYKKDKAEAASAGWKKTDVAPDSVEDLYRKLERKFED
jgi:hypothetical protein